MMAIPAIDIRGGACVQLVGGRYDAERVRLDDPVAVAQHWSRAGFRALHVVDLDAATERCPNTSVVSQIIGSTRVPTQVGGGLRTNETVSDALGFGAARVIVGTRAITDETWLATLAAEYPDRIILAADVRDRRVVVRGWQETIELDVIDVVRRVQDLPIAGLLVTAVHKEGLMQGPDLDLINDVVGASRLPVYASGGIASMRDLREIQLRGAAAAVLGMALYTNVLDPRAVAEEFGA
jgi:phosphoribosylformimino-5-aminoimidazole carboxamide ribotide isomerase